MYDAAYSVLNLLILTINGDGNWRAMIESTGIAGASAFNCR